jgi:hypothetical protein
MGLIAVIIAVDLSIFLFLWTLLAQWTRWFEVYSTGSLIVPMIFGSVCWEASLLIRYRNLGDFGWLVIKTVICFMASIQVIRTAANRLGAARTGSAGEAAPKVREILPASAGEWMVMCLLFTAWVAIMRTLGYRQLMMQPVHWAFAFATGVFVVLYLSSGYPLDDTDPKG